MKERVMDTEECIRESAACRMVMRAEASSCYQSVMLKHDSLRDAKMLNLCTIASMQ